MCVCMCTASTVEQTRWEEQNKKKRLGMRITFITIYSTYTLNLIVLLLFLNCWFVFYFLFLFSFFCSIVRSFDVYHRRIVVIHDVCDARFFQLFFIFRIFIVDLWEIHSKPLKWCAFCEAHVDVNNNNDFIIIIPSSRFHYARKDEESEENKQKKNQSANKWSGTRCSCDCGGH